MSYRLIDSNAIAIKYPEVNEMPCVFADLPNGLNGQFIDAQPDLARDIATIIENEKDMRAILENAQPERKVRKTLAEEVERIKREITDIFAEQMGVQPSAQSKRMRGRWVKDEEASSQHSESIYVCSACNNMEAWGEVEKNTFKFCPNCGADMRGEQDG